MLYYRCLRNGSSIFGRGVSPSIFLRRRMMIIKLPSIKNVTITMRKKDSLMPLEIRMKSLRMAVIALMEYLPENDFDILINVLKDEIRNKLENSERKALLSGNEYVYSVMDREGNIDIYDKDQLEEHLESLFSPEGGDDDDSEG